MESWIQQLLLSGEQALILLPLVVVAGVLTSLSPCVYPLLPITVGVISSRQQSATPVQSLCSALTYVSGLALVYGLLGVLAALTGQLFGSIASHPLTLLLIANICLLMAFWMLGWIQLPGWALQLNEHKLGLSGRSYLFLMGALSGLIAAPCTSPVLGMLLLYVASDGNPVWGATLLVLFALGMSSLLIVVGTFSGLAQQLPRAGRWMHISRYLLGGMMLLTAEYLLITAGRAF